jgi:hypothetical protein
MGGTVMSALGFIGLALFEQYNGMLVELRGDLKHFNETSIELVTKKSLQRLRDSVKENIKETQSFGLLRARMEQELRQSEKARLDMAAELQHLRERLARVEGQLSPAERKAEPQSYRVHRGE